MLSGIFGSKRGQITLLDMVIVPIMAVVLSLLAYYFLNSQTASLLTTVNQEPTIEACNFALEGLFGNYYVHTTAALTELQLLFPSQYQTALSQSSQQLSANCGPTCNLGYTVLSSSLSNYSSLYQDFINYFSSFSISTFQTIKNNNILTLKNIGMSVYLNQIPSGVSSSTTCALSVYNPENPSKPYTVYGVLS